MITKEEINSSVVRALSWKNPFAELMLHGKIETRSRNTKVRGLVLICSTQAQYSGIQILEIAGVYQYKRIMTDDVLRHLKYGYAIAIGRLVDSRPMELKDEDKCFVAHRSGLWCHIYEDVIPIEPFKWKGSQGWTTVSEEDKAKINPIYGLGCN